MSHRPPIVYPPHGIIIADSGKKGREEYANLAYKSAMACGGKVMRLNTSTCKNASEAWNMAHDRAKWEGWAWWMPLGDDDLVMPFWEKAFELGYQEKVRLEGNAFKLWVKSRGRTPEEIFHWRITCTSMQVIDENGIPLGIIETPPMGWQHTATVEFLERYNKHKPDGSWSDVYLCEAAIRKGYGSVLADAVWYCYRVHGQSQSNVDARFGPLVNYANKTGDYLKIIARGALQEAAGDNRNRTIDAERKISAMLQMAKR